MSENKFGFSTFAELRPKECIFPNEVETEFVWITDDDITSCTACLKFASQTISLAIFKQKKVWC